VLEQEVEDPVRLVPRDLAESRRPKIALVLSWPVRPNGAVAITGRRIAAS
jgi:hypothetical protein